jgi:hypothetical protein
MDWYLATPSSAFLQWRIKTSFIGFVLAARQNFKGVFSTVQVFEHTWRWVGMNGIVLTRKPQKPIKWQWWLGFRRF